MKVVNIANLSKGLDLVYNKNAFDDAAGELRILAAKRDNQL